MLREALVQLRNVHRKLNIVTVLPNKLLTAAEVRTVLLASVVPSD